MSPIQEVNLPDPRTGSRKFNQQDAAYARDILLNGGQASDGELYDKESTARSAGDSLKKALKDVEGADQLPTLGVRVVPDGEGFRFAIVERSTAENGGGEGKVNAESYSREDLDAMARTEGVEDPESLPNKKAVAKAINDARG